MTQQGCEAWKLAVAYEQRLRAEVRKTSFWDPATRTLRQRVREAYENALFEDYSFCQAHDVEVHMWKVCYYRPIEEFRSRIKAAAGAASGAAPMPNVTPEEAGKQLLKISAACASFLTEALVNYQLLVARLQAVYGDVGVHMQLEPGAKAQVAAYAAACHQRHPATLAAVDPTPSVHRCLVCMGDISRYLAQVRVSEGSSSPHQAAHTSAHQSGAVQHYLDAARLQPANGNPFNQLAVLAYSNRQEIVSVYWYIRALGVAAPFTAARENLVMVFEANRAKYAKLPASNPTVPPSLPVLASRYVRLASLLCDRINLEQVNDVRTACALGLRNLLKTQPCPLSTPTSCLPPSSLLLQVTIILLYCAHVLCVPSTWAAAAQVGEVEKGGVMEGQRAAQQPFLRRVALTALFELAGSLCTALTQQLTAQQQQDAGAGAGAGTGGGAAGTTAGTAAGTAAAGAAADDDDEHRMFLDTLLAPLNVLLSWLVSAPNDALRPVALANGGAGGATEGGAGAGPSPMRQNPLDEAGAAWQEITARAAFWRAAAKLCRQLQASYSCCQAGGRPAAPPGGATSAVPAERFLRLLPELQDLRGFEPLVGAQSDLQAAYQPGAEMAFARAEMDFSSHKSNASDNGDCEMVDGSRADSQQQAQGVLEAAAGERLHLVTFWLKRVRTRAISLLGEGQAVLGRDLSALSVKNLDAGTKEFVEAAQNLAPPCWKKPPVTAGAVSDGQGMVYEGPADMQVDETQQQLQPPAPASAAGGGGVGVVSLASAAAAPATPAASALAPGAAHALQQMQLGQSPPQYQMQQQQAADALQYQHQLVHYPQHPPQEQQQQQQQANGHHHHHLHQPHQAPGAAPTTAGGLVANGSAHHTSGGLPPPLPPPSLPAPAPGHDLAVNGMAAAQQQGQHQQQQLPYQPVHPLQPPPPPPPPPHLPMS